LRDSSPKEPQSRLSVLDLYRRLGRRTETVVTCAFTGRPARGLRNTFIDTPECNASLGYPAINYLTSPLRRAAAAAAEPDLVHLWAGTGYRDATEQPTDEILRRLAGKI
jgi:nitronate monooxygenase